MPGLRVVRDAKIQAAVIRWPAFGVTSMTSAKFPVWLRFFLLIGVGFFAAGAGFFAYRYYTRPVTLPVAVVSVDGGAAKAMSALASEVVCADGPGRLKVSDSGVRLSAADALALGQ